MPASDWHPATYPDPTDCPQADHPAVRGDSGFMYWTLGDDDTD